eukprot:6197808-Pleurochrysis_carterae.AAC.2
MCAVVMSAVSSTQLSNRSNAARHDAFENALASAHTSLRTLSARPSAVAAQTKAANEKISTTHEHTHALRAHHGGGGRLLGPALNSRLSVPTSTVAGSATSSLISSNPIGV